MVLSPFTPSLHGELVGGAPKDGSRSSCLDTMAAKVVLVVRWGSKLLELQGDKAAIAVGERGKLVSVIDKLIAAVKAGELDEVIARASRERPTIKKR